MREILFRGKRYTGEWVEGLYYKQTHYYGAPSVKHYIIVSTETLDYDQSFEYYEVIPETVSQYTGLTDKNGDRVFEGDILYQKQRYSTKPLVRDVKYEKSCGSCCTQVIGFGASGWGHTDFICLDEEFEVIGSIHDNPDLSEEMK